MLRVLAEAVAGGAKKAKSPREVGENADVVGICVPEDKHVRDCVFGEEGLLAGMSSGGNQFISAACWKPASKAVVTASSDGNVRLLSLGNDDP